MTAPLTTEQLFTANRAAIHNALTFAHLNSHQSIAGPDGCDVCGNTVIVKGRDCITCELSYDAGVADPDLLAEALARVLVRYVEAGR